MVFCILGCTTAFASGWETTLFGKRYKLADGSYACSGWFNDPETHYTYWMEPSGYAVKGWWTPAERSGIWYYFNKSGSGHDVPEGVLLGNVTIDGFPLAQNGLWLERTKLANAVNADTKKKLDEIGWDLQKAFEYCSTKIPYKDLVSFPTDGTNCFAKWGYITGTGNCYTMAAEFTLMARAMGYQARQMYGSVPSKTGKLIPHSWCEIVIDNQTRVFDPDFTYETKQNGYNIYYGKKGTWRYQDYQVVPD